MKKNGNKKNKIRSSIKNKNSKRPLRPLREKASKKKTGEEIVGIYEAVNKNYGFVRTLIDYNDDAKKIYIKKENSLNALDSDRVLVEILHTKTGASLEGNITKIVEREKPQSGLINRAAAIFIPTDPTDGYRHTRRTLLALFDVSAADPDVYVYEPLLP